KQEIPPGAIDQMSYEGHLYGLPYYAGRTVMAYNAEHLAEAGFTDPPTTWEELVEQAKVISEKGIAEFPIILQCNKSEHIMTAFEQLVFGHGGRLFDENYDPVFQEEGSVAEQALQWVKASIEEGAVDPASLNSTDHEVVRALAAGTRTFGFLTDYNLKTLNDPESSTQAGLIKMALVPGNEEVRSGTTSLIRFYGITENCDQKENAWKLVEFLGGKDESGEYFVGKKWALKFGLGFVQQPLFDDQEVAESIKEWGDPEVLREQDKYAVARPYRFTPWFQEWQTEAWGELQKAILGERDPHEVLVELAELAQELKEMY
ncbi:extracellular solute-binding protein, partial [candidate division KSB3 bacterium]|nr:extracellular solute-binding protein [candidate division KSB3 bacterium]MBD3327041.1 extracellular solute-binding protein [candidate division KSB3 bacterium]